MTLYSLGGGECSLVPSLSWIPKSILDSKGLVWAWGGGAPRRFCFFKAQPVGVLKITLDKDTHAATPSRSKKLKLLGCHTDSEVSIL